MIDVAEMRMFDKMDTVHHIITRLKEEKYRGIAIDDITVRLLQIDVYRWMKCKI